MATADVTISEFETEIGACKTALAGGDFATARQQLALAKITFAALAQNLSTTGRSASYRQTLEGVEKAIDEYERASAGTGRTQIVPIQFGRPG